MSATLEKKKTVSSDAKPKPITVSNLVSVQDLPIKIENISLVEEAKSKAVEIFNKIQSVSERIDDAKKDAEYAKDMKTGFFGGTSKKTTATSKALVRTNEAISEMNDLIQEAILFTKSSIEYSTVMIQAMSKMVEHGFKNANGEIVELNESGEEFAQIIISQADEYTNRHLQLARLQEEQSLALSNVQNVSDENDERLANEIKFLKELSDQSDIEIERLIHKKSAEILKISDEQDAIQKEKITALSNKAKALKEASDANDLRHDAEIQQLFQLVNQLQGQLDSHKKSALPTVLSITSILINIVLVAAIFKGLI